MKNKMRIEDENPAFVKLAVEISKTDIPVGIPSPPDAATPGTYFGAIAMLKHLEHQGMLAAQNEEIEKLRNALFQIANSKLPAVEVWGNGQPCWLQGIAKKALGLL
jgi:hypothetical protein